MFEILLYPVFKTGPAIVGLGEIFSNKGSQKAGKLYFEIGFATTVNTFFNSGNDPILHEFSQVQNKGVLHPHTPTDDTSLLRISITLIDLSF